MRDLYKRLGLDESSDDGAIRAAVATADPATREAAEFILLDPRRREVYDRNRQVLATVGTLRAKLGLNLARFWPRSRFADFTIDLAASSGARGQYIDPMTMAWAFGVHPVALRGPRSRLKRIAGGVVILLLLTALLFVVLRMTQAR
jgi:hypothetical protein